MALVLNFGSITENKKIIGGISVVQSYDIMIFAAVDTAPTKPVATKTTTVDAAGRTPAEMQTAFKDQVREWWNACEALYDREVAMRGHVNTAITDLIAET